MLGVLASIALIVGGLSSAMVLTEEDRLSATESHPIVVDIAQLPDQSLVAP